MLCEEEAADIGYVPPEYSSPISVLDNAVYTLGESNSPSPIKYTGKTLKVDVPMVNERDPRAAEECSPVSYVSSSVESGSAFDYNRKKLQNIDNLVQKLRRLNSSHDEARTDYIASLCENTNPDHRYISEILLASGLLLRDLGSGLTDFQFHPSGHPIHPELFLVLEQKKASSECMIKAITQLTSSQKSSLNGNPRRILQWFSDFAGTGGLDHGKGAKALSQFAFVNRDICWEELEWKGKHGQSPAMVAAKPHYFLDLDVQRTVENFIEYVPEFWSSHEFSESLKDGSILMMDAKYFVDLFTDLMYEEELEEVWQVIDEFLMDQSFSFLCHHLLIILDEKDLRLFLDLIPKYVRRQSEVDGLSSASDWLEIILSKYSGSTTIDQLLLLTAVTSQGRHLLRLLQEEGSEEQKGKIKNLVSQLCELRNDANDLAVIMRECLKRKPLVVIKRLGMQSWAIHFRLSHEFHTAESWESLFISNGIKFRKSNKYALLNDDELLGDSGSDYDRRTSGSLKRKKHRKHKKKRKRDFSHTQDYEDDLAGYDILDKRLDLQCQVGDWMLATDGYSTTWSIVDLPEHLSRHCFNAWLKWFFAKSEKAS